MTEANSATLHRTTRSWYGVPVDITVSSSNIHRVIVGGIPLPHLGVVNFFSRWGLPLQERLELTSRHELGHVQTLPVPLLHLLFLLWPRPRRQRRSRRLRLLAMLVAHQAMWELAAEGYVIATAPPEHWSPRTPFARLLYAGFWIGMALLAAISTVLAA